MKELDEITLKRAIKGDKHAFKSLYDHYAPFIWKVLFPLCERDMTIAREVMQTTFIKTHRALTSFKGNAALSTWLYRIAYTSVMEYFRKRKTYHTSLDPDQLRGSAYSDSYEVTELVQKILKSLSTEDRFLLISREVDALTFDELAHITGKNSGTLRTRLHRLKEQIRDSFPIDEQKTLAGVHYEY